MKLPWPVSVEQHANHKFRVTYGQSVRDNLTYVAAAHEFGECVFHGLACDGKLDNTPDR